jgi:hypothetical protein
MLAVLTLVGLLSGAPPGDARLAKVWSDHGTFCEKELRVKGPWKSALRSFERRGIGGAAARYLIVACASPYEPPIAVGAMRAALLAGPRERVSPEVRRLLASSALRELLTVDHRALVDELEASERAFAQALIDDDPVSVAKLEQALASVPESAPASARDERRFCLAAALARAGRVDEARRTLPAETAYPKRRKSIEVEIAARGGDLARVQQLLGDKARAEDVPCERALRGAACAVVRSLIATGQREGARALQLEDCGAFVDWAEGHASPFEAYLELVRARLDARHTTPTRGPRLLAKLGRPDLALAHLQPYVIRCAAEKNPREPTLEKFCTQVARLEASFRPLAPKSQPPQTDAALLARLSTPARWRAYEVVAPPPGKVRRPRKPRGLPPGADVVFAAVEGARAVAVALASEVDPRGEVSAGGYAVYLSEDAGRSWRGPFHSGFAAGFPFYLRTSSTAPVFDSEVLQLPVDVREIDPASITFPPTALRALREERGRLVRIPLAALEQDSDGDDLTDLLEERLGTDPQDADTDGDGTPDAWDQLPLERGAAPSPDGRFAAAVLDEPAATAIVHEPASSGWRLGPAPSAPRGPPRPAAWFGSPRRPSKRTRRSWGPSTRPSSRSSSRGGAPSWTSRRPGAARPTSSKSAPTEP